MARTLTDDILSILAECGNKIAVSDLLASLQSNGLRGSCLLKDGGCWRGLGTLSDFEHKLTKLGFNVYASRNDRGNAGRFVSLGDPIHPAKVAPTSGFVIMANGYGYAQGQLVSRFKSRTRKSLTRDLADAKVFKTRGAAEKAAVKLRVYHGAAPAVVAVADLP